MTPDSAANDDLRRLADPTLRLRLQQRALVMRSLRSYLDSEGFLEVETGQLVDEPGQEPTLDPFRVRGADGVERFLITSPELRMKAMLAAGYDRIYQLSHCFRSGLGETSPLHNPEFTLLEWYRTGAGESEILSDVSRLLVAGAAGLRGPLAIERDGAVVSLDGGLERLTVQEAFRRYAGIDLGPFLDGDFDGFREAARVAGFAPRSTDADPDSLFFRILLERVEAKLGRGRPTALVAWPASMAALARLDPADPRVAQRFEIYVAGVELANGFVELTDAAEQRRRFEAEREKKVAAGRDPGPFPARFLRALEHGMPEASGIALGVDRLLMLLVGARSITELLAFPEPR